MRSLLTVLMMLALGVSYADARPHGRGTEGALVRCQDVTQPAILSSPICGSDALQSGLADINGDGRVQVTVLGARPSTTYTVFYRSSNGVDELLVGALKTDAAGNGSLSQPGVFAMGDIGSGALVLTRENASALEFVTGFEATRDNDGPESLDLGDFEFEGRLVRCIDVTKPVSLAGCGTDTLQEGRADFKENGKLAMKLINAAPNTTYTIVYRSIVGPNPTEAPLGTMTTNASGNGSVEQKHAFAHNDVGAGTVVFKRNGADQFVLGFRIRVLAAVLPTGRSVTVGTPATAFATIINTGQSIATGCRLTPVTIVPATFSFQTTNPSTNQVIGTPNQAVDIPAGGAQTFVFAFIPTQPFPATEVAISFTCTNAGPDLVISGLNTFVLSASATPVADIVSLAATLQNDGIVNIVGLNGTGIFAVAVVNVGVGATITVSTDTAEVTLPVSVTLCPTNNVGACVTAPAGTVTLNVPANGTATFGVFVTGVGLVPFDPGSNRIFVHFTAEGNTSRGSTSVAARTQ